MTRHKSSAPTQKADAGKPKKGLLKKKKHPESIIVDRKDSVDANARASSRQASTGTGPGVTISQEFGNSSRGGTYIQGNGVSTAASSTRSTLDNANSLMNMGGFGAILGFRGASLSNSENVSPQKSVNVVEKSPSTSPLPVHTVRPPAPDADPAGSVKTASSGSAPHQSFRPDLFAAPVPTRRQTSVLALAADTQAPSNFQVPPSEAAGSRGAGGAFSSVFEGARTAGQPLFLRPPQSNGNGPTSPKLPSPLTAECVVLPQPMPPPSGSSASAFQRVTSSSRTEDTRLISSSTPLSLTAQEQRGGHTAAESSATSATKPSRRDPARRAPGTGQNYTAGVLLGGLFQTADPAASATGSSRYDNSTSHENIGYTSSDGASVQATAAGHAWGIGNSTTTDVTHLGSMTGAPPQTCTPSAGSLTQFPEYSTEALQLLMASGSEERRAEAIEYLGTVLSAHLARAFDFATKLQTLGGEFSHTDTREAMALYDIIGLDEGARTAHPTKFQQMLERYKFPPPQMETINKLDYASEETQHYMLGVDECSRRARRKAREKADLQLRPNAQRQTVAEIRALRRRLGHSDGKTSPRTFALREAAEIRRRKEVRCYYQPVESTSMNFHDDLSDTSDDSLEVKKKEAPVASPQRVNVLLPSRAPVLPTLRDAINGMVKLPKD